MKEDGTSHGFRDDATAALHESIRKQFALERDIAIEAIKGAVTTAEREALEQRVVGLDRGWFAVQVSFGGEIRLGNNEMLRELEARTN